MIYAISDIHGCDAEFSNWLARLGSPELFKDRGDKLVLLGDYIDYGNASCQVLERIYALSKTMGGCLIVLRGNHEETFLEWLKLYSRPNAGQPDEYGFVDYNGWLDEDNDFQTFRTFLTQPQWDIFQSAAPTATELTQNIEAARMILANHREMIAWLRRLPYYYETEKQIFVHAGIDESYPRAWQRLTQPHVFVGKFPATTGHFPKDIIAGHIAASAVAEDRDFRGIFFDGESHYYIDGSVQRTGRLLCFACDETTGACYEVIPGGSETRFELRRISN